MRIENMLRPQPDPVIDALVAGELTVDGAVEATRRDYIRSEQAGDSD